MLERCDGTPLHYFPCRQVSVTADGSLREGNAAYRVFH